MCFVWISEQTAIISLYNINRLIIIIIIIIIIIAFRHAQSPCFLTVSFPWYWKD